MVEIKDRDVLINGEVLREDRVSFTAPSYTSFCGVVEIRCRFVIVAQKKIRGLPTPAEDSERRPPTPVEEVAHLF